MTALYLAAGGGGDAVGVLLLRRLLRAGPAPLIATIAWERLRIDPEPGPRGRTGFDGLATVDGTAVEITAESDTIPPGRSSLPRLAASTAARLFLLDLDDGAAGMTAQLVSLGAACDVSHLVVIDIGGDIVGTGREPGLRSPLADAVALAAAHDTGLPTTLVVAGPGLDAELSPSDVTKRLVELHTDHLGRVDPSDVDTIDDVLSWHPTEATALLAAAARGVTGTVDMRRGDRAVPLDDNSASVWSVNIADLDQFPVARAVSSSQSLAEAETATTPFGGSELAYERTKAAVTEPLHETSDADFLIARVPDRARESIRAGASLITTRRLLEAVQVPPRNAADFMARLDQLAPRHHGLLWSLDALTALDTATRAPAT
ncbi:MAG: DUF1152 domain-containing protein [Phycicoccus sp.]